jgi:hypothetical protein
VTPEERRTYNREWMRKRRADWFSANGPCVDCSSWDDLELDHNSRADKVSHRIWSWSEERRAEELAKCVARCRKCHRAKTTEERKTWSTKPKNPTLEQSQREMRIRMREQFFLERKLRREARKSSRYHTSITQPSGV